MKCNWSLGSAAGIRPVWPGMPTARMHFWMPDVIEAIGVRISNVIKPLEQALPMHGAYNLKSVKSGRAPGSAATMQPPGKGKVEKSATLSGFVRVLAKTGHKVKNVLIVQVQPESQSINGCTNSTSSEFL